MPQPSFLHSLVQTAYASKRNSETQLFACLPTFHARIADFEEQFQIVEARFGLFEIFVRYSNLALPLARAFRRQNVGDVGRTAEISRILDEMGIFDVEASTRVTTSVQRFPDHDDLVPPTLWSEGFHRTDFVQRVCWMSYAQNNATVRNTKHRTFVWILSLFYFNTPSHTVWSVWTNERINTLGEGNEL